jgi:hypothetical protein
MMHLRPRSKLVVFAFSPIAVVAASHALGAITSQTLDAATHVSIGTGVAVMAPLISGIWWLRGELTELRGSLKRIEEVIGRLPCQPLTGQSEPCSERKIVTRLTE